jgi:hypothetical protein
MSGDNQDSIFIKASSSSNGVVSILVGCGLILLGILTLAFLPQIFFLPGVFIISGGIVGLIIGWFKLREPNYSLELTKEHIVYHHRRGKWRIHWDNIQRVDVPRVTKGIETVELEMLGFRLKNSDTFLDDISMRLITHLLLEQRPLVMHNIDPSCETGRCYGDDMIEDEKFIRQDGTEVKGVTAMFGNRMAKLKSRLGYDVYISTNELDRSPQDFIKLVKDCQETVLQQRSV